MGSVDRSVEAPNQRYLSTLLEQSIMDAGKPEVSVVLPVYNESSILRSNVLLVESVVKAIASSYEIIIVEDGSTDGSDRIAETMSRENPKIIHLHSETRLGKGNALKKALKYCKGETVVFMDIDLATNLRHVSELIDLIRSGHAAIVGSRLARGARVRRPISRKIASLAYNLLVNVLFYDGVFDHQCGFKGFSRKALAKVIDDVNDGGFFFDTEIIVRLKRKGFSVVELPLEWTEPRVSYLHEGPLRMLFKLLALRFSL